MATPTPEATHAPDDLLVRPTTRPLREPQRLSPAMRVRRAVTLLVLTCIVPGSAQIAAGNRQVGSLLLRAWLSVVGLAVLLGFLLLVARGFVLGLVTSPPMLILLALGCYAAAIVVPVALWDAWRLGRVRELAPRPRLWISVAAVVLMVASSLAFIGAGRRVWAGADLISSVFGSGTESAAADGRFNVLLLGGDAGPDRIGTRPDSMTLASIDAATGRTVLFSLPRNLEDVPFAPGSPAAKAKPEGWSCGDNCLLNGIYTWGTEHRSLFPGVADPGAEAMKEAVEGITGLHVNYYVLIDLKGFSSLIDAMGGIRVTVNTRVPIGGGTSKVSGYIEPGDKLLDGYHALWYARSRHGASDYERMARQRCVMDAMLHQLDPGTVLAKFQDIAAAGKQVVSTDIPAGELGTFLDLAAKAKSEKISSVQFVPPLINPARPDFGVVRAKVATAVETSEHPPASSAPRSGGAKPGSSAVPKASSSSTPGSTAESADVTAVCSPT
jgi:polyisoprenyl-teichoic acid--peptidoglycan teichoic acid transferase